MKPPPFAYTRAGSLEDALALLADDPDAKLIAGGQSLVPMLNLRLARPSRLIDINRLPDLDGIRATAEGLTVGPLVRHHRLIEDPVLGQRAPLLVQAARHIGHAAIRNRGTCGGSLAHADPTAELPAAMVALEASFRLRSVAGERVVPASDFFQSSYLTALRDDEMLVEIMVPARPEGEKSAFLELTMREGDFAIVAVAALVQVGDGKLGEVRVVWSGADFKPVVAEALAQTLRGQSLDGEAIERLSAEAAEALSPPDDIRASSDYRRHALTVLTARAVRSAAGYASPRGIDA
jgi:CO/xanthine dehydrogenase FAD-binding subunit